MNERIFIGVGSNIDPERNIPAAGLLLMERVTLKAVSTFYRTPPMLRADQGDFLNGVFEIRTSMPPRPLKFDVLRSIETALGRKRSADAHAPREIDLDLLVYGSRHVAEPDLEVPDPDIVRRAFVAVPFAELAPELELPGNGRLADLDLLTGREELRAESEFTQALKERLGI